MANDEQSTPDELYLKLHKVFKFKLDAAASKKNAKCKKYFTKKDDALSKEWKTKGWVWLNPPYSKKAGGIYNWYQKAFREVWNNSCKGVVCLIRADTSSKYFLSAVEDVSGWTHITFLQPRIAFGKYKQGDFCSSMLLVITKDKIKCPKIWNWKKENFKLG